jgi:hypothetical protein
MVQVLGIGVSFFRQSSGPKARALLAHGGVLTEPWERPQQIIASAESTRFHFVVAPNWTAPLCAIKRFRRISLRRQPLAVSRQPHTPTMPRLRSATSPIL